MMWCGWPALSREAWNTDARHIAYCIVEIRNMETGVKAGDSSCGNAMAHESLQQREERE